MMMSMITIMMKEKVNGTELKVPIMKCHEFVEAGVQMSFDGRP